jgi:hypothetical protein
MPLLCSSIGTAAVATIFLIYNAYRDHVQIAMGRDRILRERVTYMLWAMASQCE